MKKRLLLAVLPALLVLASCSAQPKAKAEPIFEEDTLAHEEVFGGNDKGEYIYKETKLNFDDYADVPTNDNLRPAIGVQHQVNGNNISIRFVAAIKVSGELSEATATWTRAMYKADGSILKDFANMPSQKAYTAINNAGNELLIQTFNGQYETHYDYFVVYTMLNIDKTQYANCYLNAYLTLGDGKQTMELAVPVSETISANTVWKFEASQRYFLRFNPRATNQYDVAQDAVTQGDNPSNNYASFTHSFDLNDEFVIVANDVANKRFKIYDASCLTGTNNPVGYFFDNASSKIKTNFAGDYVLYLNKSGELWQSASNVVRPVYIKLAESAAAWSTSNQIVIYAFKGENHSKWFATSAVSGGFVTNEYIDPAEFNYVKIVEISSGQTLDWSHKVSDHETDNLAFPSVPTFEGTTAQDCAYAWHRQWADPVNYWGSSWGAR